MNAGELPRQSQRVACAQDRAQVLAFCREGPADSDRSSRPHHCVADRAAFQRDRAAPPAPPDKHIAAQLSSASPPSAAFKRRSVLNSLIRRCRSSATVPARRLAPSHTKSSRFTASLAHHRHSPKTQPRAASSPRLHHTIRACLRRSPANRKRDPTPSRARSITSDFIAPLIIPTTSPTSSYSPVPQPQMRTSYSSYTRTTNRTLHQTACAILPPYYTNNRRALRPGYLTARPFLSGKGVIAMGRHNSAVKSASWSFEQVPSEGGN